MIITVLRVGDTAIFSFKDKDHGFSVDIKDHETKNLCPKEAAKLLIDKMYDAAPGLMEMEEEEAEAEEE